MKIKLLKNVKRTLQGVAVYRCIRLTKNAFEPLKSCIEFG